MTVREYIGARYVPLFMGDWSSSNSYEPLSIVTYQGNTYTSRQAVPSGIAITNESYWAETGNYNAQIEAYREEVLQFDDRITQNESDIEDLESEISDYDELITTNANNIEKLAQANVLKSPIRNAYISTDGNDETAALNNQNKPFRTLDAAIAALGRVTNSYRLYFLTGGNFTLTAAYICGGVWHWFTRGNEDVYISVENNLNGFYVYDSHFNLWANATSNFHFIVGNDKILEFEGSTFVATYAEISCEQLYCIQGSFNLTNVQLNCWVRSDFAHSLWTNVTVNNQSDNNGIWLVSSIARFYTGNSILKNLTGSTKAFLYGLTSVVSIGEAFACAYQKAGYKYGIELRGSFASIGNDIFNAMDALGDQTSIITTNTVVANEAGRIATKNPALLFNYSSGGEWAPGYSKNIAKINDYTFFVLINEGGLTPLFGYRINNTIRFTSGYYNETNYSNLSAQITISETTCTLNTCGYVNVKPNTLQSGNNAEIGKWTDLNVGRIYGVL